MALSFLATFDLNTHSYSALTVAKGEGGSQVVSFSYKMKVEQDVRQSMNFEIWKKIAEIFLLQIKFIRQS